MAKPLKRLDKTPPVDEKEKRLQSIIGSMRIEGFEVTDELIERARLVQSGELDADEEIARILAPYKSRAAK